MAKGEDEKDMSVQKVAAIVGTIGTALFSEGGRKFLCGTYADGTPRSVSDALSGEIYSPEERNKKFEKYVKNKNKKKSKKKGKKKNKPYRIKDI